MGIRKVFGHYRNNGEEVEENKDMEHEVETALYGLKVYDL